MDRNCRASLDDSDDASETSGTIISPKSIKIRKKRGPRPKILTRVEKKQKRLDANDRER